MKQLYPQISTMRCFLFMNPIFFPGQEISQQDWERRNRARENVSRNASQPSETQWVEMRPTFDVNESLHIVLAWDVMPRSDNHCISHLLGPAVWGDPGQLGLGLRGCQGEHCTRGHFDVPWKIFHKHITLKVTLHVAFVHAFVNPALLMVLHRGIRQVIFLRLKLIRKEKFIYICKYKLNRST